jgi:hypothetical protein
MINIVISILVFIASVFMSLSIFFDRIASVLGKQINKDIH